jgi:hypothetical protein
MRARRGALAACAAPRRPDTLGRGATNFDPKILVQLVLGQALRASIRSVQVVLRKLGRGSRAVVGRLVRAPRKGSVIVIEFSDGMHEYVTTPVKRVLRLAGREVFYIETVNSRYRLEVRGREVALDGAMGS